MRKSITNYYLLIMLLLINANQAKAQSGVEMKDVSASYTFGQEIIFTARIESSIPIQQATISIRDPYSGKTRILPLVIGANGQTEFHFDVRQNILPPFVRVYFSYQVALNDGQTFSSEEFSLDYIDNRFGEWKSRQTDSLIVHWYDGDDAFGQAALDTAQAGLQSIANLMPLDLARPIDIYLYRSTDDLQGALYLGGQTWEAGYAIPELDLALAAVAPGPSQSLEMEQRIPHELTHVMLYRRLGAGYKSIPAWLNEGFATLAELNPNPDYDRALTAASQSNSLIPIKDLCASFPADSGLAFQAYAEARSFSRYLRDTYGSNGLLNLANIYASSVDCNSGTTRAFGTSLDQLEYRWRTTALGQNAAGAALKNIAPYLILLGLVVLVPLIAAFTFMQKKGKTS